MKALVLVALGLVVLAGAGPAANDQVFRGVDYGDMIDSLRQQLDADSYSFGGDASAPSTINRIRLQLRDIRDRLTTEATSAAAVFANQEGYFIRRITKVNSTLETTKEWLDDVKNQTRTNSDRIVDRQLYLKQAPALQSQARLKIETQNISIVAVETKRALSNIRYNHRVQNAKATLAGAAHVASFMDGTTLANRITNLRDTLNVHHDPSMTALIASLGAEVMQERVSDLGDVKQLLRRLRRELHAFIVDITKTEVLNANSTAITLATMRNVLTLFQAELDGLVEEEVSARKEIADLMEKNIRMHKLYPARVAKFQRLLRMQRKLIAGHIPLARNYARHKAQRDAQLKRVDDMLNIIHVHYDHEAPIAPPPQDK